jgi:MinD-like ATPase involved in chromosome partitioning or flagellar assembly
MMKQATAMASRPPRSSGIKSLAIVSGKGGSGKTLVAAALAHALALERLRVLLVDADLGTGGLTYYLGFSAFDRARAGLTEYLLSKRTAAPLGIARARAETVNEYPATKLIGFLPVGEHRLLDDREGPVTPAAVGRVITKAKAEFDVVIFDCRGGIDMDSIAVCHAADEVLIIAETDAASIQASQYLSNKLYELGIGRKIIGFLLNKVMDDPTQLAKAGEGFFKSTFIGAIPFDLETTRGFIKGEIPSMRALFGRSVAAALLPAFGYPNARITYQTLAPAEFGRLFLNNPNGTYGAIILAVAALYASGLYAFRLFTSDVPITRDEATAVLGVAGTLLLFALSDPLKQALGSVLRGYVEFARRLTRRSR